MKKDPQGGQYEFTGLHIIGIIYQNELWHNYVITLLIYIPGTGCTLGLSAFGSPLMEISRRFYLNKHLTDVVSAHLPLDQTRILSLTERPVDANT